VLHRIGALEPGEPIVFVAAASAHRQAAFDACAFVMDYLKTRAPFWKKERPATARWVEGRDRAMRTRPGAGERAAAFRGSPSSIRSHID
jgi:molybdopterin synthase catalytic subunit